MAQGRIKNFFKAVCKIYIAVLTLTMFTVLFFSYFSYVHDGDIYDFCIPVKKTEFHYFSANSETGCLIDWWPFLLEATFIPLMIFLVLIAPAVITLRVFSKRNKGSDLNLIN